MDYESFKQSTQADEPPPDLTEELTALWHAARGDWDRAHNIAQDIPSRDGSWIHAYLHREEGDASNAGYWYSRAGKPVHTGSTDEELDELIQVFVKKK